MSVFVNDAFTGASGTDLTTYSASWVNHPSSSTRTAVLSDSNRVRSNSGAADVAYYNSASPSGADYRVSADIRVVTSASTFNAAVLARADTSATTWYAGILQGTGTTTAIWSIWKAVAGTWTQISSTISQTVAANTTYSVKLECIGSAIKLYINGSTTPALSVTDTSITSAGKAGIRFHVSSASDSTAYHIDNVLAEDVISLAVAGLAQAQILASTTVEFKPRVTASNLTQPQAVSGLVLTQHNVIAPAAVSQTMAAANVTLTYLPLIDASGRVGQVIRFRCELDGVAIPITSMQLRKQVDRGWFMQVVTHDTDLAIDSDSTLTLYADLIYLTGAIHSATIAETTVTTTDIAEGATSRSITISGEDLAPVVVRKTRPLINVTNRRVLGGATYLRAQIDLDINQGDRVRIGDDIMDVDMITYFASAEQSFMEVSG